MLTLWQTPIAEYKRAIVKLNTAYNILVYNVGTTDAARAATDAADAAIRAANANISTNVGDDAPSFTAAAAAAAAATAAYAAAAAVRAANADAISAAANAADEAARAANADVISAAANAAEEAARAVIRDSRAATSADYARLLGLKTKVTDASETGPLRDLWYGAPPDWYIREKATYEKTIVEWERELGEMSGSAKISMSTTGSLVDGTSIVENEVPLEFYIDRGSAPKEVVQEVFDAISNLNFAAGGFGYLFKNDGKSISIVPAEVDNDF